MIERKQEEKKTAIEALWKHACLDELRGELKHVVELCQKFEQLLEALPACDACVQKSMLDEVETAGVRLGGEIVGLTTIAETLTKAMAAAEKVKTKLSKKSVSSCRCPPEKYEETRW